MLVDDFHSPKLLTLIPSCGGQRLNFKYLKISFCCFRTKSYAFWVINQILLQVLILFVHNLTLGFQLSDLAFLRTATILKVGHVSIGVELILAPEVEGGYEPRNKCNNLDELFFKKSLLVVRETCRKQARMRCKFFYEDLFEVWNSEEILLRLKRWSDVEVPIEGKDRKV